VSLDNWIGLLVAVVLAGLLVSAVLLPERF
jgi:hypothetical protein